MIMKAPEPKREPQQQAIRGFTGPDGKPAIAVDTGKQAALQVGMLIVFRKDVIFEDAVVAECGSTGVVSNLDCPDCGLPVVRVIGSNTHICIPDSDCIAFLEV